MNDGIRKAMKISTLKKLNGEFDLGLSNNNIENMSTSQLRKKIFQIKSENNLTIKITSKYQNTLQTNSLGDKLH